MTHSRLIMNPGDTISVTLTDRIPGEYTFSHQDVWDFLVMKDANELQDRRQRELMERAQRNAQQAAANSQQAALPTGDGPIAPDTIDKFLEDQKKKIN